MSNIKWSFEVLCLDIIPPISPNYLSKDLNVSMLLFLLSWSVTTSCLDLYCSLSSSLCLQALSAHGGSLSNDNHQKYLNEHIIKMRLRNTTKLVYFWNYFYLNPKLFDGLVKYGLTGTHLTYFVLSVVMRSGDWWLCRHLRK